MKRNPLRDPPSEHPEYMSEDQAIANARGAAPDARAIARLMTRAESAAFEPSLAANNAGPHPDRKVWIVTVHADAWTRGSLTSPPQLVHVYSVAIDAETGWVTDFGYGSEALHDDSEHV